MASRKRQPPPKESAEVEATVRRIRWSIFLIVAALAVFWTWLFWKELPEMWAPYGMGLGFMGYVVWLFRK